MIFCVKVHERDLARSNLRALAKLMLRDHNRPDPSACDYAGTSPFEWGGEGRGASDSAKSEADVGSYLSTAPPLSAQSLKAPRLYTVAKPKSFSTLPLKAERPPEAQ